MLKKKPPLSLISAAIVLALTGCRSSQTDPFKAKPKAPATATAPEAAPRPRGPAVGEPTLRTESFIANPKSDPRRVGPGPNDGTTFTEPQNGLQQMEIHFIQVGQGDATLLNLPNGTNILIDAGSLRERDPQGLKAYLEDHLANDRIDTLVITHPDADHYNLLPYVVSDLAVGQVLLVGEPHEYGASTNVTSPGTQKNDGFQHWLENPPSGTTVRVIGTADIDTPDAPSTALFQSGDVKIWILSAEFVHDTNSRSIVLLVNLGEFEMLLTGDAEKEVEEAIMARYQGWWLDVDCLKLGHHGSRGANSKNWLSVVQPEVAIASAAEGPIHGHPNQAFQGWLEGHTDAAQSHRIIWWENRTTPHETTDYREAVYSTATNGTIVLRTDGQTFDVTYAGSQTVGPASALRIAAVLPDPDGPDAAGERVRIRNSSSVAVSLADWRIADSSGSYWPLTVADGSIPPNGEAEVVRLGRPMSLNNDGGDHVVLIAPDGTEVDRRVFGDATEAQWIVF